jgi:hypothetical protein
MKSTLPHLNCYVRSLADVERSPQVATQFSHMFRTSPVVSFRKKKLRSLASLSVAVVVAEQTSEG